MNRKFIGKGWLFRIIIFLIILLSFFLSIELMVRSLTVIGKGAASQMIKAAEMPFIAIFIGLLTTALIQSSSSVTSIAVAMVASQAITLETGVYIIMGANIGTTITSDIVSLGFITNKTSFRKAISSATVHDFFNMFTVIIIFPLEYYYGLLSESATLVAHFMMRDNVSSSYPLQDTEVFWLASITQGISNLIKSPVILLIFSVIILVVSIKLFSNYSFKVLIGESRDKLKSFIFDKPGKSFLWGMVFTGALQSSSITTSMVVPLVALRKVQLQSVFPFILGANIGTTITALLAAILKSEAAISLALAHLFFNLIGVLIFLPFRRIRSFPENLSSRFGQLASEKRIIGFFYILLVFFIIPFILIYISQR